MKSSDPILDWHLNDKVFCAIQILAEARVAELLTPNSLDPIHRQIDEAIPTWTVWGPDAKWELLPEDALYQPNIGALLPAAMAWLGQEKILVYRFGIICIVQPDGKFTVGKVST